MAARFFAGFLFVLAHAASVLAANVDLEPATAAPGYVARLLINETPFPGDPLYRSEEDTKEGMLSVLWVLDNRIHHIPVGYTQEEIAAVRTSDITDIMTARGQVQDFFRGPDGQSTAADRVFERVDYLLRIANEGSPGRFARLLNHAQELARSYFRGTPDGEDMFAQLRQVGDEPVTGRGFAWMTADLPFEPGGNFVPIPNSDEGVLGGNRFYTLRRDPQ